MEQEMIWEDRSILFAPLHYVTGEDVGGSEMQWAFEIAKEAAGYTGHIDAVVCSLKNGDLGANVSVHQVDPAGSAHYFKVQERLRFVARYSRVGLRAVHARHYDLLHHVLPWGKHTFNPLILTRGLPFAVPRSTRVVMGPLQNVHEITFPEDDEGDKFQQGFQKTDKTKAVASSIDGSYGPLAAVSAALCRATLNRADALIAVNDATRSMLLQMGARKPIHVIPAGIRPQRFPCVDRSMRTGPLQLVSTCYFLRRKGIDLILAALARARTLGVDVHLTLGGDGPQRANIEQNIDDLDLRRNVTLTGFVKNSELAAIYAAGDAFVTMSWAEAHPVSLMEAMSTGLPVLAAANIGARHIVVDDVTGSLIEPGNVEQLAQLIVRYDRERWWRLALGDAGRRRVLLEYDWSAIGKAYRRVYESVSQA